jgi:hypothetical protein
MDNCLVTEELKMGVIKGVLREELENSLRMIKRYKEELQKYPGGVFLQKKIRGHKYYYLALREGKKVRFIYKGKELPKEDIAQLKEAKEMRKRYKDLIKKLNKQIKYLNKALRGQEDV